ncbi:cell division activator CedA [Escherichia coli]
MKKPLRQQNRQIISYVPRTEPAPPEHAIKMDSFRDVWMLRGKYVAFVLMGSHFCAHRRLLCLNPPSVGQIRSARKMRSKNKKHLSG